MTIPGLRIDPDGDTPVYRQIVGGIRAALQDGRLAPGSKLPPTRDLARQLGVNRNTVVAAYDDLAAQGLVQGHAGRGTFLAVHPASTGVAAPEGAPWFTAFSRAVEGPGVGGIVSMYRTAMSTEGISFAGSYPAADLMPLEEFGTALATVLGRRGAEICSYGPTAGYPPLREAIAASMRRKGSRAAADGVLVTNGSQQALELIFRILLDPGDPIVVESPTYTGALSALASLGARLVPVPMDEEGIRPDLLQVVLERHRPKLLYVQPTFQNPTSRVMGAARRTEVLALAARYRCAVVEDDWADDLRLDGDGHPTLHALDGGRHVVYLSTFSKKLLPGIRLGWVAAPPPVHERLVALKQIEDHGTSPLLQAALHEFLEGGGLEEHLGRIRPAYRERRDRMIAALERSFPAGVGWARPEGGLFLWVTLPAAHDSNALFAAARERGILFSRGELFHSDGLGRHALRLTYAAVSPDRIESGVATLGALIRELWPENPIASPPRAAEAVPIL